VTAAGQCRPPVGGGPARDGDRSSCGSVVGAEVCGGSWRMVWAPPSGALPKWRSMPRTAALADRDGQAEAVALAAAGGVGAEALRAVAQQHVGEAGTVVAYLDGRGAAGWRVHRDHDRRLPVPVCVDDEVGDDAVEAAGGPFRRPCRRRSVPRCRAGGAYGAFDERAEFVRGEVGVLGRHRNTTTFGAPAVPKSIATGRECTTSPCADARISVVVTWLPFSSSVSLPYAQLISVLSSLGVAAPSRVLVMALCSY